MLISVHILMQKKTYYKYFSPSCVRENGNHRGVDFDEVTVLSTLKYKVTNHVEQQTFIDKMGGTVYNKVLGMMLKILDSSFFKKNYFGPQNFQTMDDWMFVLSYCNTYRVTYCQETVCSKKIHIFDEICRDAEDMWEK